MSGRFLCTFWRGGNNELTLIGKDGIATDKPENMILNELTNFPEIDYDTQTALLQKLVAQAVSKVKVV